MRKNPIDLKLTTTEKPKVKVDDLSYLGVMELTVIS